MINILDSSIYNRIAAGEVVERPLSVVKELVENAVDAGATSIDIEIKRGGIDYIKVFDNGGGIEPADLKKALLPHATSKINSLDDLNAIATLGFRGEALSSIAAVSVISIMSRPLSYELGAKIVCDYGVPSVVGECGCQAGTSVTVEKLFDKIPARKKFLRTAAKEGADIERLVGNLILANPEVSFKLTGDGKTLLQSGGEGMEGALISLYGHDIMNNLMPVSMTVPDINISGYVNKPSYSRHNKTFQTLIVNGRYVESEEISFAVYLCFKDYLMTRQYPMYALYIDLPLDMVDVNVHPNKMEVKFADGDRLKSLLRRAVNERIKSAAGFATVLPEKDVNESALKIEQNDRELETEKNNYNNYGYNFSASIMRERPFRDIIAKDFRPENRRFEANEQTDNSKMPNIYPSSNLFNEVAATGDEQQTITLPAELKIIGGLFDTYILVEREQEAFFIDQHAAHERIVYDRLKDSAENVKELQDLLVPYVFSVSFDEYEAIKSNLDTLTQTGFILEELSGRTFMLRTIPVCCSGFNERVFVSDLLSMLKTQNIVKTDFIKDKVMQSACKAAVKGGDKLSPLEIESLLNQMKDTETMLCPHGRPIVVRITKMEIEKWFRRLV